MIDDKLFKPSFSDNSFDALYDVTIAYPDVWPENAMAIIKGAIPENVCFHIKRLCALTHHRYYNKFKKLFLYQIRLSRCSKHSFNFGQVFTRKMVEQRALFENILH